MIYDNLNLKEKYEEDGWAKYWSYENMPGWLKEKYGSIKRNFCYVA
jgi:hypothetical protein